MSIRVELWPVAQGKIPGLARDKAQGLYGGVLSPERDADSPTHKAGLAALRFHRARIMARFGMTQPQIMEGSLEPAIKAQFTHNIIVERAVLMRRAQDGAVGVYPIAHIGPGGFRLLTLEEATDSMAGHWSKYPPPGGFAKGGLAGAGASLIRGVNNAIAHPVTRAAAGVGSLYILIRSAIGK